MLRRGVVAMTCRKFRRIGGNACGVVASRRRGVVAMTCGKFRRIGGNACGVAASWRRGDDTRKV